MGSLGSLMLKIAETRGEAQKPHPNLVTIGINLQVILEEINKAMDEHGNLFWDGDRPATLAELQRRNQE